MRLQFAENSFNRGHRDVLDGTTCSEIFVHGETKVSLVRIDIRSSNHIELLTAYAGIYKDGLGPISFSMKRGILTTRGFKAFGLIGRGF